MYVANLSYIVFLIMFKDDKYCGKLVATSYKKGYVTLK